MRRSHLMPRPNSRTSVALANLRGVVILIVLAFHSMLAYLALLWHFWFGGSREERFTVRASQGWKPHEEVEDGLPDGGHARLWWRSCVSFFSVPLL
jgi:hypothetical protein